MATLNSSLRAITPDLSPHLSLVYFSCSWSYWWKFTDSEPVRHFVFLKYLPLSLLLLFQEVACVLACSLTLCGCCLGRHTGFRLGKGHFSSLFHSGLLNIGIGYLTLFGPPKKAISWIWVIHPQTNLNSGLSPPLINCQHRKQALVVTLSRILTENLCQSPPLENMFIDWGSSGPGLDILPRALHYN